jgi:tight adherence protein B
MGLVIALVFLGVFTVVTLLIVASGTGASQKTKQVLATLDAALASGTAASSDPHVDLRKDELLSAIPMIHRLLLKVEMVPALRAVLFQANVKWTAGGLLLATGVCFAMPGYLVYARTDRPFIALVVGLACGSLPLVYVFKKRAKRFGKFEAGLPQALDLMVSALRVGHSLNAAMALVTRECADPVSTEFKICFDEHNYGLELKTAMDNLVTRVPLQDLRIVVTAIMIQKESGGNLAEVLDKTSAVIRERFRLRRQVATHTAAGRLTGWILSALPVFLGAAIYLISPDMISVLWTTELGVKMLYISGIMTVIGAFIIHKICQMDV